MAIRPPTRLDGVPRGERSLPGARSTDEAVAASNPAGWSGPKVRNARNTIPSQLTVCVRAGPIRNFLSPKVRNARTVQSSTGTKPCPDRLSGRVSGNFWAPKTHLAILNPPCFTMILPPVQSGCIRMPRTPLQRLPLRWAWPGGDPSSWQPAFGASPHSEHPTVPDISGYSPSPAAGTRPDHPGRARCEASERIGRTGPRQTREGRPRDRGRPGLRFRAPPAEPCDPPPAGRRSRRMPGWPALRRGAARCH